jgi:hypothetical protein
MIYRNLPFFDEFVACIQIFIKIVHNNIYHFGENVVNTIEKRVIARAIKMLLHIFSLKNHDFSMKICEEASL